MPDDIDQSAAGRRAGPPQARPDPLGGSLAVPGERGAVIRSGVAPQAHLALRVDGLDAIAQRLRRAGVVVDEATLFDAGRIYVVDPFGNRLELIEPAARHDLETRHVSDVRIAI